MTLQLVVRPRIPKLVLLALGFALLSGAQANLSAQPAPSAAQPAEIGMPVLESHSAKEFNSFGQVWTILQDHRGVMYMGVSGGDVLEYDGVSWR